jgi:acetoin utilization protein AcuB
VEARAGARLASFATMTSNSPTLSNGNRSAPLARTTIAEVMTTAPHTIGRDQKLAFAHDLMREHRFRHLPVLDGGQLVGVLSQRDLYFNESIGGADVEMDSVAEVMTSVVFTVAPGDCVADVAQTMAVHKYGCAIVVDRGHVVGIFTSTDALALLARTIT